MRLLALPNSSCVSMYVACAPCAIIFRIGRCLNVCLHVCVCACLYECSTHHTTDECVRFLFLLLFFFLYRELFLSLPLSQIYLCRFVYGMVFSVLRSNFSLIFRRELYATTTKPVSVPKRACNRLDVHFVMSCLASNSNFDWKFRSDFDQRKK